MDEKELYRYDRQVMLKEIGEQGQIKLKEAKVLVVGAGGLGSPVLQYLCAAGVGTLGLIDPDIVSETNLQRQVLYNTSDICLSKAEIASQKLSALNPFCKLVTYPERLTATNAKLLIQQYDIVVDCTDNFTSRYLLDETCQMLNKPLVYGSIEEFSGQVSVFHHKKGISYKMLYPDQPSPELMNGQPLGVFGAIPGVIGSLQAVEVIKIITGTGTVLSGKLLLYDALKASFRTITFSN